MFLPTKGYSLDKSYYSVLHVGVLVPQPGIEPTPHALEVQSLNHWTAKEVLK